MILNEKVLRKIMKVKELVFTELFVAKPHYFYKQQTSAGESKICDNGRAS